MAVVNDTNRKDQLDEVQALESIYSGTPEWFSYNIDNDSHIRGCITVVLPKVENGIAVQADGKIIHICHLPPLSLYFTFPQNYPSHSMPLFSLYADWLDSVARRRLKEILIDSWTSYCGIPILFTWIELLKEEAMQIVLSQKSKKDSAELLKTFIEFNDRATQNDFESEWYDCEVCFSSKSGKECVRFMPCGHVFCMECTSDYYRQKLHDNLIRQLQCLNNGCDSSATQTQIRQVLTDKEFEVYEQRLLEGALDLMSDVVICPRISCQAPVIVDGENSSLASCSLCHYSFCMLCKKAYHGIELCSLNEESRGKMLNQVATATPAELDEIYRKFGGKKQFERMIEALKSEEWIGCNSKPCPSCQAKIEKTSGCNKMICTKCGHYFCWLCGIALNKNDPYSHFNTSGPGSCYNRLFEGVEDDDNYGVVDDDVED
ncbi:RWD domain-containing protein [Loa loa]|uniref:RBR-type E3 ubiquitin transferase n=1 Tax=Loa loa TaxID=7209 RepID=A0A1S0TXW1_LOALO|nr:RWD domain-containing protein [Loa loa]EFO21998.1 RWD domain-containing protein [Loa loa]